MKKNVYLTFIFLSFSLQAQQLDLSQLWSQIVWCGPKMDKALICHHAGGTNYNELCVSINSLKRGHLTVESGITCLHGDDYFGKCGGANAGQTSIFACNAAIKSPQLKSWCVQIGDSQTCQDSLGDFIQSDIFRGDQELLSTDFIDDFEAEKIRISTNANVYNEITNTPFETLLFDDTLSFNLHSANYGAAYSVDWCILRSQPKSESIDVALTLQDVHYLQQAKLVSRFELWCGDNKNNLQKIDWSETAPLNSFSQYTQVTLPPNKYCLWRQKFFETQVGKRLWQAGNLQVFSELEIH